MDFRTREFRSVVRFTGNNYSSLEDGDGPFTVHAACDGLLLMSYYDSLYICNPATRQWASVCPPTLHDHKIAGLYVHSPSGEYRMLSYREVDRADIFFITTVGSNSVKCITFGSYSPSMRKWLARGSKATEFDRPFLSYGKLYWLPQSNLLKNILVFDTMVEEFSWLPSPVVTWDVALLLEMEGTLAMSISPTGGSKVDLWVLQDYKSAVWVHKYQTELPVAEIRLLDDHEGWTSKVVSPDGDVLVDCFDILDWQLHYDKKGNLLRKFLCNGRLLNLTTHILKESLVAHPFFRMQEDGSGREPPFFRGL
jgi:F-box interacting protein